MTSRVRNRSRFSWTLAFALTTHATVLALALLLTSRGEDALRSPLPTRDIEIDIEQDVAAEEASVVGEEARTNEPSREATPKPRHERSSVGASTGIAPSGAAPGPGEVSSAAPTPGPAAPDGTANNNPGNDGWTFSPTGTAQGPLRGPSAAIGRAMRDAVQTSVDDANKEQRSNVIPLIGGADISLGMIGTHVAALTRERVRTGLTPLVGTGLLEVVTDVSGNVISVRVLDVSAGRMEWNDVARQVLGDARGHKVHVPRGARGVVLTIQVTSSIQTASGYSPNDPTIAKVIRAVQNPLDTIIDSSASNRRVISSRVVDARAL